MSKLKITENLFLEVNELNRFVEFLKDEGYKKLMKAIISSGGIVLSDDNSFKVEVKPNTIDSIIINPGLAFNEELEAIILDKQIEMQFINTGIKKWLIISRDVTNYEKGEVSISLDGTLSGVNTKFTEVLRGQFNFPTKVKFNSSVLNTQEYEVVKVISDTQAILAGNFTNESGLKYSVFGTFTPGFQPLEENKLIYEYDYYKLEVIESPTKPILASGQYIIASVEFDAEPAIVVTDERQNYEFNSEKNKEFISEDILTTLTSVNAIGSVNFVNTISVDFEMILQHGYVVKQYNISNDGINILDGNCNFLGDGNIPDNLFKNWILLNRTNMKKVIISGNVNKRLYFSSFSQLIFDINGNNDFVIIPDYKEIEYEVKINGDNNSTIPFYFKKSIYNINSRINFYAYLPSTSNGIDDSISVEIRYRLVDGENTTTFKNLSVSQFLNVKGETETLSNSSFSVNLADLEPQTQQRNYS